MEWKLWDSIILKVRNFHLDQLSIAIAVKKVIIQVVILTVIELKMKKIAREKIQI